MAKEQMPKLRVGDPVYFLSAWASKGIVKTTVARIYDHSMIAVNWSDGFSKTRPAWMKSIALTEEAAREKAEALRARRVASLLKQVKKIESMAFEVVDLT